MAANVGGFLAGSIVAKMFLDTKGWKQGVDGIKKDELTIKTAASKIGESLALAFKVGAAAMVATIGTLGAIVRATANAGDAFNDMSKRTGIAVEDLSAFELLAKKTGTSIEGMAVGFRGLSSRMLDASRGVVGTKAVFDELGISVTDGNGRLRSMKDVLLDVADRFSKMEDGTRKAALAQDLFGRSGMELIPMLNEGRAAILANTKAAERLGLVWSKADAAAADLFNDVLAELGGALRGIRNDIGKEFIPVFTTLVQAAVDGLANIRKHVADLAKSGQLQEWAVGLGKTFIFAFKWMVKAIEGVILAWGVLKAAIFTGAAEIARRLAMMVGQFLLVVDMASKVIPGLKGVSKDIAGIVRDIIIIGQSFSETGDKEIEAVTDIAASFEIFFKELDKLNAALLLPPKAIEDTGKAVEKWMPRNIDLMGQFAMKAEDAGGAFSSFQALLGPGWGKPLVMGEPAWKSWTDAEWEADLNASFDAIKAKNEEWAKGTKRVVDKTSGYFDGLYNDIATGFGNALQGMFEGTMKFSDAFKSIWNAIKAAFFRILGEMVAGFIVKFVKKIVAGMNLIDAFSSALGIAKTVTTAATTAASAATAASTAATAAASTALSASSALSGFVAVGALWLSSLTSLINKNLDPKTMPMIPIMAIYGPGGYEGGTDMPTWTGKYRHTPSLTPPPSPAASGGSSGLTFNISAIDGADVVNVVKKKIIPILREAARRREFSMPMGSAGGV